MSAAVQWDAPADPGRGRRHLRAVPTGPSARGGGPAVGVRVAADGLRLTARGRRLLGVLIVVTLLVGAGAAARAWAAPSTPVTHTVTVQQGDTLWAIAHRAYPSMETSEAVAKVALANDLNGLNVVAGRQLQLPD
ncbi:LysM peptidoglycan-binding domain-containing protein [Flexivirga sp. B27]